MPSTEETFHELVGKLDYPMFIVTTTSDGERSGCLVGFTTQCSIDPPRFLVCLSASNRTARVARAADALLVHLVPAEATELAELFGSETGDEVDKFERCAWHEGPRGLPVLDECERWFAGDFVSRTDTGDHYAVVLAPFAAEAGGGGQFEFHRAKRMEPGHPA